MSKEIFFAGGGTGGHLYPAIAVAEQIVKLDAGAKVRFFCSSRKIDSQILSKTPFGYTELQAKGFSLRPAGIIDFCKAFFQSCWMVKETLSRCENPMVIGVGGFVAAPACWTAYRRKISVKLINVDIVPGKANKVLARFADEIFVQFEDTRESFGRNKNKVKVVGCPLRNNFENLNAARAIENLGLEQAEKDSAYNRCIERRHRISMMRFARCWGILMLSRIAGRLFILRAGLISRELRADTRVLRFVIRFWITMTICLICLALRNWLSAGAVR